MRKRTIAARMTAVGLAASVAALSMTASASNAEAKPGVGAGTVSTNVLDAALGDLLGLTLLEDVAGSTTDPKLGQVGASSVFRQLKLSSTISALNKVVGEHKVSAPEGQAEVNTSLLNLNSLGLGAVVSGALQPLNLKALHTPSASTSSSAKITDLGLLGGLASLGVLNATDKTGSGTAASEAARAMTLDALSLLDLGKLLQGLGLDILNLPLSVVSALLTSFGIPIDLQGATSLTGLVTSLQTSIDTLLTTVQNQVTTVTTPVLTALGNLGLPLPLQPVLNTAIDTVLTTLQTTLNTLISTVIDLLENATLLKVNALDINTQAKATDTVAGSTATASGKLGGIQIGNINLPGLDLLAITSAVNALLAQITNALGSVLAPLGLGDLLSVKLFDKQTGVTQSEGVVKAVSSITALVVKLGVPSAGLLSGLNQPSAGVGSILSKTNAKMAAHRSTSVDASVQAAAVTPAVVTAAPNPLAGLLGVTSVLSKGLSLRVGTVQSQSLHAVPATPGTPNQPLAPNAPVTPQSVTKTPGTLPRTGGEQTALALLAMGLGAVALGARRLRRGARS
jgi:hypothetical protein